MKKKLNTHTTIMHGVSFEKYQLASEKYQLVKTAERLDIPVPQTIFIKFPDDISNYREKLYFPVVLKPMSSLIWHNNRLCKAGVKIVNSYDEMEYLVESETPRLKRRGILKRAWMGIASPLPPLRIHPRH